MIDLGPLYPIFDPDQAPEGRLLERLGALAGAGARLLQVRVKTGGAARLLAFAERIQPAASSAGLRLVVNDRPDVALLAGAGAVHLGQDDLPVAAARAILGPEALVGLSTHDAAEGAAAHAAAGAARPSYLGFGPIFATSTRPMAHRAHGIEGLKAALQSASLPIVAIGGIDRENVAAVRATGACAAVISAISGSDRSFGAFLAALAGAASP